jgi:hypothetical protein
MMEGVTKKLLIEAENCIWVMQNNDDKPETVKNFAIKFYKLTRKILKQLKININDIID